MKSKTIKNMKSKTIKNVIRKIVNESRLPSDSFSRKYFLSLVHKTPYADKPFIDLEIDEATYDLIPSNGKTVDIEDLPRIEPLIKKNNVDVNGYNTYSTRVVYFFQDRELEEVPSYTGYGYNYYDEKTRRYFTRYGQDVTYEHLDDEFRGDDF
jgi:hypothetical protein